MATNSQTTHQPDPLEQLMLSHKMPTWRLVAWPVMIFVMIMIVWSFFVRLDEVSTAQGEVVPQGKIKVIQHLEGGIVEDLFVSEGDTVRKGQPLLQLDMASSGTNANELQVRLDSEKLVRARLTAEATGNQLEFPEEIARRRPALENAQREAYLARRRELNSTLRVMEEQMRQKELEVEELIARAQAVNQNYRLAKERFKMSASLLAEGLTARMDHLELQSEVEKLKGERKSLKPAMPKAKAAVEEIKRRLEEGEIKFRREAQEQLGKSQQDIARITELLSQANEQGLRTEIKSPIDGVVKNMVNNTIGGVVRAGEPIMEIVPIGENLVIQAKLNPTERGFVNVGQRALVKISAYDFARYGGLEGEVIRVAPDASTDENGAPYFQVIVRTDKNYLGTSEGSLPITPGMQAGVDILTGEKTVMDYIVSPILKLKYEAFRER